MIEACGVILAGGRSSRMGFDKTGIHIGGETLLMRSVRKMAAVFPEVIVVGRAAAEPPEDLGVRQASPGLLSTIGLNDATRVADVRLVRDILPDCGPLGGIQSALRHACHERIFVTACDMPFWDEPIARLLVSACAGRCDGPEGYGDGSAGCGSGPGGFDAAVPQIGHFYEPLLACYDRRCLPAIEAQLAKGQFQVQGIFPSLNVRYVSENELRTVCDPVRAAFNINRAADLDACREALA